MAHLFVDPILDTAPCPAHADTSRVAREVLDWNIAVLDGSPVELFADTERRHPLLPRPAGGESRGADDAPLLMRTDSAREQWIVIAEVDGPLRVNGERLTTGIRSLHHRDELRLAGASGRAFLSLERLCRVEAFDGDPETRCPRCKLTIDLGDPSVRCSQCGTAYHQSDGRACWLYSDRCALDDQLTDLSAGFRWIPSEPRRA